MRCDEVSLAARSPLAGQISLGGPIRPPPSGSPLWPPFDLSAKNKSRLGRMLAPRDTSSRSRRRMRDARREGLPAAADLSDTDNVSSKPRRVRRIARAIPGRPRRKSESRVLSAGAQFGARDAVSRVAKGEATTRSVVGSPRRPPPAIPREKARSANAGANAIGRQGFGIRSVALIIALPLSA